MKKLTRKVTGCALALLCFVLTLSGCGKAELPPAEPLPPMPTLTISDEPTDMVTPVPNVLPPNHPDATPVVTESGDTGIVPDGNPDPKETPIPENMSYSKNYKVYADKNSDVVGWIDIPNTKIHYPVVLGTDNKYYETRNYDKKASKSGAIFMDYRNGNPAQQWNLIIYGHNMKNGTMFADINEYKNENFFKKNNIITFYWQGNKAEWEVFSAFVASDSMLDSKSSDFVLRTKFGSNAEYEKYIKAMQGKSKFTTKIKLSAEDQIITLQTCTYEYDKKVRYIVMARRKK